MSNSETTHHKILADLIRLTAENERLRTENKALRRQFEARKEPPSLIEISRACLVEEKINLSSGAADISGDSPKEEKIALFRRLFRGRGDVYPLRWVSKKTGKAGYSPAIKDPWEYRRRSINAGKATEEPEYLPLTDQVIQEHLEGRKVVGVYPLLGDETCWLLAVDFDGKGFDAVSYTHLTLPTNREV